MWGGDARTWGTVPHHRVRRLLAHPRKLFIERALFREGKGFAKGHGAEDRPSAIPRGRALKKKTNSKTGEDHRPKKVVHGETGKS